MISALSTSVVLPMENTMQAIVSVQHLSKIYSGGHHALKDVSLDIAAGEILALLGPNGAGKTTLISIICGIVNASSGSVTVDGHDIVKDYRATRGMIGLVPQELTLGAFDTVWNTLNFSRGLFGKKPDPAYLEQLLKDLSLWEKRDNALMTLSGGMKRRLMIARAMVNEPRLLILDEPTAGVDIEIRRSMWEFIREINESGTTVILTTHYLEEAEELCRNIAIIDHGEIIQNTDMKSLLGTLDVETFVLDIREPLSIAPQIDGVQIKLRDEFTLEASLPKRKSLNALFSALDNSGVRVLSMRNKANRLEELFLRLVDKGVTV